MHLTKTKDQISLFVSLAATLVGPSQLQRLAEGGSEEAETLAQQVAQNVSHYIEDTVTQILGNGSSQPTGMKLPENGTTFAPLSNGTTFGPLSNGTTFAPRNATTLAPSGNDDGIGGAGIVAIVAICIVILLCLAGGLAANQRHRKDENLHEPLVGFTPDPYA
ncbi:MAG: uncharacterized protein KVP18_000281 [Porospora cf. gigantea A]|uniref:uncharacterized protein n=1 Tax=Porospora cf. gigantea A TaxID=2853593 RepID=UPI00355A782E|nr:MAG: hypothetical protein KVP18_000281 [Porospora cf. gigantea A]